jgi:hypothetical protein
LQQRQAAGRYRALYDEICGSGIACTDSKATFSRKSTAERQPCPEPRASFDLSADSRFGACGFEDAVVYSSALEMALFVGWNLLGTHFLPYKDGPFEAFPSEYDP